uniref:Uncharacterized protein n=1 Tax=Caudovirales sp. ctVfb8 TaxID=2825766 RepID=A0A8S5V3G5_9CAUD|nr:MAG TPA: hypothetical protein [Caudovirales sp. ctVfb8]
MKLEIQSLGVTPLGFLVVESLDNSGSNTSCIKLSSNSSKY